MASPYPVQFITARSSGSAASVTTGAITTTSGNLLVALVFSFGNNIGATPLSDSKGNTWSAAIASTGTTQGWGAMFYVANATGGASHTFTFTPSSSDFIIIFVIEIAAAALSNVLNNTSSSSASTSTPNSGSISANAGVDEIFVGGGAISNVAENLPVAGGQFFAATPFAATASNEGGIAAVRSVPSGGSGAFSYTKSAVANETVLVAGFKGLPPPPVTTGRVVQNIGTY